MVATLNPDTGNGDGVIVGDRLGVVDLDKGEVSLLAARAGLPVSDSFGFGVFIVEDGARLVCGRAR